MINLVSRWMANRWVVGLGSAALACVTGLAIGIGCASDADEQEMQEATAASSEKESLSKTDQEKLDEYRAEVEVGRNMAGRLLQFYGSQNNGPLLNYVNEVGTLVGRNSEAPQRHYMFQVLNSEQINAFACPGGYILVTMGAIRNAQNEAELAGILGHEVAHVAKKHMFDKLRTMSKDEVEGANQAATKRVGVPPEDMARQRPRGEDNEIASAVAKYLAGTAAGLNLVKAAGAGMGLILEKGLGAEKEYEADQTGVRYATQAGYDPNGLSDFLCRIQKNKTGSEKCDSDTPIATEKNKKGKDKDKEKPQTVLDKTHPPVLARLKNIDVTLQAIDAKTIVGARGSKRFKQQTERLPVARKGH